MIYKFYVQMEGQSYGPYTVKELMELPLLDDTLLTEESMNGEWLPARRFDFEDMLKKRMAILLLHLIQQALKHKQTFNTLILLLYRIELT